MPPAPRVTATAHVPTQRTGHQPGPVPGPPPALGIAQVPLPPHPDPAANPGLSAPTHPTPPDAAGPRTPRRRQLLAVAIAVLTLGAATTAFTTAIRAHRGAPPLAAWHAAATRNATATATPSTGPSTASVPATASYTIPGDHPHLPWPTNGQATIEVEGLGSLGHSGTQQPMPIASITKVMVAYLVLRDHPLTATSGGPPITVTPAEAAAYPQEQADNESLVPVAAGEVLTEHQALTALLLPSADNIARILARWDAGTIPAFLSKMNTTAAALGMTHTHYTDPSGYAATTVSTATDQVTLAEHALTEPALAQIAAQPTGYVPLAGTVRNYNTDLGTHGITGIKTGSTTPAGGCLLFAATHTTAGHTYTLIGAVLGQPGTVMHGLPQALLDSQRLVTAVDTALSQHTLIATGQHITSTTTGTPLRATQPATVPGWPGLTYHATLHLDATTTGTLTLTAGSTTATITVGP